MKGIKLQHTERIWSLSKFTTAPMTRESGLARITDEGCAAVLISAAALMSYIRATLTEPGYYYEVIIHTLSIRGECCRRSLSQNSMDVRFPQANTAERSLMQHVCIVTGRLPIEMSF